ncbi:hypothetical protein SEA_ANON_76 [Gordonia phage Anon]|nr:hypothetical protein SEA_ANON_76 [Gordonia phage Anon]
MTSPGMPGLLPAHRDHDPLYALGGDSVSLEMAVIWDSLRVINAVGELASSVVGLAETIVSAPLRAIRR